MSGTVVVVGAGQAGAQAAASLRDNGWAGRVILVGEEPRRAITPLATLLSCQVVSSSGSLSLAR